MASSLISSSHHIDFDFVFSMEDASLAPVFESLITMGLKEFLGCPAIFYEATLTEFFANGSVKDGLVVSTIGGTAVEISESVFAAAFELPSKGLTDLSDVPKNLVFDARSLFSDSKEQVSISCFKKELKIEYRLLHDILAKTIYVKAVSPPVKKTPKKKAVSKKRPVESDDEAAPVVKQKRTTKGVTAGANSLEIRKAINVVDAKILLLDGQVSTIRSEQLEFQAKVSADLLSLSTQIGDLVDYIRSGDAKKEEGSSIRRPLPTPVHHSEGTGDVVRLTEPTQEDIDNANRAILERMSLRAERERDGARRERRLSRSGAYKRRRGF
ncbi:hypothetical protein F511_27748 [Dorcoceras hygrometricum]|uniref:Uncharacterized protein n=1 Tax=Dorcoceras hygrometricum TaxID=472368 RepID=A0A2Z7CEQ6_9LAMI|nr:hypothetical protein F511_27748 [Dorcoceras hygrometricum]